MDPHVGGLILDRYIGFTGDDIAILMTHTRGVGDRQIHKLAWDAFVAGTATAKEQGLHGAGQLFRPSFTFLHFNPDEPLGFRSASRQPKRLTGKTARIVATMRMPPWVYRWWFHPRPDKTPFQLAGVRPIRESLIGWVEAPDRAARDRWIRTMRELGSDAR